MRRKIGMVRREGERRRVEGESVDEGRILGEATEESGRRRGYGWEEGEERGGVKGIGCKKERVKKGGRR